MLLGYTFIKQTFPIFRMVLFDDGTKESISLWTVNKNGKFAVLCHMCFKLIGVEHIRFRQTLFSTED